MPLPLLFPSSSLMSTSSPSQPAHNTTTTADLARLCRPLAPRPLRTGGVRWRSPPLFHSPPSKCDDGDSVRTTTMPQNSPAVSVHCAVWNAARSEYQSMRSATAGMWQKWQPTRRPDSSLLKKVFLQATQSHFSQPAKPSACTSTPTKIVDFHMRATGPPAKIASSAKKKMGSHRRFWRSLPVSNPVPTHSPSNPVNPNST